METSDEGWPEELRRFLVMLDEQDRRVLILRFGFDCGQPRTLEEVGEAMGLSRDEVRSAEARGMSRLMDLARPRE